MVCQHSVGVAVGPGIHRDRCHRSDPSAEGGLVVARRFGGAGDTQQRSESPVCGAGLSPFMSYCPCNERLTLSTFSSVLHFRQ